jgi:uncharacterized SAM-binding protein YcdF (DUF218 family)
LTRRRHFKVAGAIVLVAFAAAAIIAFRAVGNWLIREDALAPSNVIVVLSGSMPARAERAATVYRMGYAPEVWVSRPESEAADLAKLGVHYIGEEEYDRQVLIHEGVPESAIHIFPGAVIDTEQEVQETARLMRAQQKTTVIIVTSPPHTRRVRALWRNLVGENPKLIVRAAWEDTFDSQHWWKNTRDTFAVIREIMGLLNVWLGLPVRPHVN